MKKKIAYGVTGLILGCIFLFPIYILIMNSFKTTKGIFTDVLGFPAKGTFTLENYKNAFQELDYIRSFMNSLLITVVTAVLVLLISAMAAWITFWPPARISMFSCWIPKCTPTPAVRHPSPRRPAPSPSLLPAARTPRRRIWA